MSEPAKSSSSFVRVFLPGLALGLIIGALAGAYLSTIVTESPELPKVLGPNPNARGPQDTPRERDSMPAPAPTDPAPVEPAPTKPADGTQPTTPPQQPSTPPATTPK